MLRLADEIKNEIKKVLKDVKYKDSDSGREIAFSTAYSRGNQKAVNDYQELFSRFKEKEKENLEKKKTKQKTQLTKKVKVQDFPKLNEKTIKNIMTLDSWMVKKRKEKEKEFNESKAKIEKNYIEDETKIVEDPNLSDEDKEKKLSELEKNYKNQLAENEKYLKTKNRELKKYSSFNKEDVEALSSIFNEIPNDIAEDGDFLENFVNAQNTFNKDYRTKDTSDALDEINKEIKAQRSIKDISKEINKIKSKEKLSDKETEQLEKLKQELGEVTGALFIKENVVLNPSTGLPKFKNKKFMTPKVMTKLFESQHQRYSKLPPKEKNILVSKLETKIKNADPLQKEIFEKALDGALGASFTATEEEKKEIKIPKTRIIPDPKLMKLADKFNRLEEVCESTRISNEPKTNREMTAKLLHSLSDEEFMEAIGDSALYKPMLQVLDPNYCPMHPANQNSGPDVSDKDCPVRVSEKDKIRIKNNLIELYQDSSFFVAGGLSFETSGYDDIGSYSKKVEDTKKNISANKTPKEIKDRMVRLTHGLTNSVKEDVLTQAEADKLSKEIRQEVTQEHINKFGEITTALLKTLEDRKTEDDDKKMKYICSAFKDMPGFPKLPGC